MTLLIFSQLVGRPIVDAHREKVARLVDLIVRINPELSTSEETYPPLSGLVAYVAGRDVWIPMSKIASFGERVIGLTSAKLSLERFVRRDGEILLGRDVLDKQLVDTQGRRVIRVNDLTLSITAGSQNPRLVAVDISLRALSRRIFFSLSGRYPRESERLIDWADVQYFGSLVPAVKLHVSHQRLGTFHPADLARVLEELSHQQRDEVVRALDDETVAYTLEELDASEAADILEEIGDERASDILEVMSPDVAADVVADMQEEKAETLLSLMDITESEEVRELLLYPSDSAGGLMTNEFVLLPASLAAAEALRNIRAMEAQPEFIDYIYVAEEGTERMIGVASLRNVVLAADRALPLSQLMEQDIISVHPLTPASEAAALLTTYGLRALPVVDEEEVLLGIITFDDALNELLTDDLRERIGPLFAYHRKSLASSRVRGQQTTRIRKRERVMTDTTKTGSKSTSSHAVARKITGTLTLPRIRRRPRWLIYLGILGPGLIAASAGNDAGGIYTYSSMGSQFGYTMIWVMLVLTLGMGIVQEMCARMGAVTGKGLSDLIRENFPIRITALVMFAFLLANSGVIVSEFIGIAAALNIFHIPAWISAPSAGFLLWWLIVKGSYARVEKLFLLLTLVFFAYFIAAFMALPNWGQVFNGSVIPTIQFNSGFLLLLVTCVGTTISPYMQIYVQSAVVERGVNMQDYPHERIDVYSAAIFSNIVAAFIIIACAATLFVHSGGKGIALKDAADAALALAPFLGQFASNVFAIGLLGASFLAAGVLPLSTCYSITEALGLENGVSKRWKEAPVFWGLFTGLIVVSVIVAMVPDLPVVQVLLNLYLLNGIVLPIILFSILRLVNDKRLMGAYTNGLLFNILAYGLTVVVSLLGILSVVIQVFSFFGIQLLG